MSKIDKDLWQYTEWWAVWSVNGVGNGTGLRYVWLIDWFIRNIIISYLYKHALYARLEGMIAFEFWTHTNLDGVI